MAIPKEHEHVPFLTQMILLVSNLGFQSISEHYERPCIFPSLASHIDSFYARNFRFVPMHDVLIKMSPFDSV